MHDVRTRIHFSRSLNVLERIVELIGFLQFTFVVEPEEGKPGWAIRKWGVVAMEGQR
jgi:hypothetical protein